MCSDDYVICILTITPPWQTFAHFINCFVWSTAKPSQLPQMFISDIREKISKSSNQKCCCICSVFQCQHIKIKNMHSVFCYWRYDGLRMTCAPLTGLKWSWWPQIWPQVILWRQQLTNIITIDRCGWRATAGRPGQPWMNMDIRLLIL